MRRILVVDDESVLRENICAYLICEGYDVRQAKDGDEAYTIFKSYKPDLVVLDLMLPRMMGEDVCMKIREVSNVPIIILTAKSAEESIINCLAIGADDYMTKPFSVKELVARVNSLLRRSDNFVNEEYTSFNNGELKIDYVKRLVLKNNRECVLTKTEFDILEVLSKFSKKVFTRDELLDLTVEGYESYDRVIDTHIKNLRKKIENSSSSPEYIITVRGIGYKFGGK